MEAWKLRTGFKVLLENEPFIVVKYMLRPNSRWSAKMVTKMKNLITGSTIEKTFQSSDNMIEADITTCRAQFLYATGEDYFFMDNDTYEQFDFDTKKLWNMVNFLKDDMEVSIMKFNWTPINIELPPTVIMEVIETEPGVRWDTATWGSKPAKVETGAIITVPLFMNVWDKIVVNTMTKEYKERAK